MRGPKMSGRRNGGRSLVRTQWEPNQIGAPSERVEPADEPEAVWVPVVCAIELQGGRTKAGLIRGEGGIGGKNGRNQMALHLKLRWPEHQQREHRTGSRQSAIVWSLARHRKHLDFFLRL